MSAPSGRPAPRRVLVIQASSVSVTGAPDTGQEFRQLSQSISGAPYGHAFDLDSLQAAQARDLPERLIQGVPAVLHFSGRGTPGGGLRFLTDDGGDAPASHEGLRKLLAEFAPEGLQLVVLSACWTDELALLLTEVVPCVIGTAGPIHDLSCLDYSRELYRSLAYGRSVGSSHRIAVAAVELYGGDPSCLPELRTAAGVNGDAVFVVGPEFRVPPPRAPVKPLGTAIRQQLRKRTFFREPPTP
ncbi:hypothetical protein [Streptomyces sp. V1I1]|uniref:hypothetical protein n=1 Tax=Streptomyces sp. V1I1 TaxID=3042272 RepID=UPI0027864FAD|nr:hypothetical protein [Streptomyces sp. V1I1]MDQ0944044.1 hypothetical protein [Streptomyces sp. V1I1]